jgi:6-phosphofructokinase 2
MMKTIATLTMNPAIDVAYEADRVMHTHKIRSRHERYDPGGGGINVARVVARLGGTARAHYLAGGATGKALDALLDRHQLVRSRIDIAGETRVCTSVFERESGKEFRFVPRGPIVTAEECRTCLAHLERIECDYLVASGSLPKGAPDDFYSQVGALARRRKMHFVLDTSGPALTHGLSGGGAFLVKPSLGELQHLVGRPLAGTDAIAAAALEIVGSDRAEYVAVTMGQEGALLAHHSGILHAPAVPVEAKSAVGAGDSFLAAMIFALAAHRNPVDAFRYGLAAGAAAVETPGTDLCHRSEVERIYARVPTPMRCREPA